MYNLENIQSYTIDELKDLNNGKVPSIFYNNGLVTSIQGKYTNMIIKNEDDAIKSLYYIKDLFGISNPSKEFEIKNVNKTEYLTSYKLQQIYEGYLVYPNDISIVVDSNGETISISGKYSPIKSIDFTNKFDEKKALEFAKKYTSNKEGSKYESKEVIYAYPNNLVRIAWMITYTNRSTITDDKVMFIDAENGELIFEYPLAISGQNA